MEKRVIDGITYDVYTMEDWAHDHTIGVKVGQAIAPEVFWQLCEALPPHKWTHSIFQPGEPDSYDFDRQCQLYQTFESLGDYYYKYVGLKP